jgi:hypothetical protein
MSPSELASEGLGLPNLGALGRERLVLEPAFTKPASLKVIQVRLSRKKALARGGDNLEQENASRRP